MDKSPLSPWPFYRRDDDHTILREEVEAAVKALKMESQLAWITYQQN